MDHYCLPPLYFWGGTTQRNHGTSEHHVWKALYRAEDAVVIHPDNNSCLQREPFWAEWSVCGKLMNSIRLPFEVPLKSARAWAADRRTLVLLPMLFDVVLFDGSAISCRTELCLCKDVRKARRHIRETT